jgi:integrase
MRRSHGSGTIDRIGNRFRPRLPAALGRTALGIYDTEADAERVLAAAMHEILGRRATSKFDETLAGFGPIVLDDREKRRKLRSVDADRCRFRVHLKDAAFAKWHLSRISRHDVLEFRDFLLEKTEASRYLNGRQPHKISPDTARRVIHLLSAIFERAIEKRLVESNPAKGIRIERAPRTHEPWTYLTLEEQQREVEAKNWPVVFSFGTGIRHGEWRTLELSDVHLDGPNPHITIRYGGRKGGKKLPAKNGKIRTVPVFGVALLAAREWLAQLPTYCPKNKHGLMFPRPTGGYWERSKAPDGWNTRLERRVRWHDLRHTCASALVSGMWSRSWALEEVSAMLGHSSITVTQRYAHLAQSALTRAASETNWYSTGSPIANPASFPGDHKRLASLWLQLSRVRAPSVTPAESQDDFAEAGGRAVKSTPRPLSVRLPHAPTSPSPPRGARPPRARPQSTPSHLPLAAPDRPSARRTRARRPSVRRERC